MGDLTTGLLTRRIEDIDPPYGDYPPWVKAVVIEALAAAWERLVEKEPGLVSEETETEITTCLQTLLNDLRQEAGSEAAGFSGSLFETVTREGSEVNYNGVRLEKKPDLVVRLRGLHPGLEDSQFRAIFIECKIVSRSHPVRLYCQRGISRFVEGDYAWSMPSALMVAYARDSMTVEATLKPHLGQHYNASSDPYATSVLPTRAPALMESEPGVYVSRHERPWEFPHGASPGPIDLLHLWLPEPPEK